jgi:hypothetical protein
MGYLPRVFLEVIDDERDAGDSPFWWDGFGDSEEEAQAMIY